MRNVLYEATFKFDLVFLIPVVMMIFIAVFPIIWKKSWEGKYTIINYKAVKVFCTCCFIFALLFSVIFSLSQSHMYKETVVAYINGDYEIIEGYVQDFIPYVQGRDESFTINNVSFSYSDYDIQQGYNNTKSHGGVITGNGQHLRIGYVNYNCKNIIVYIEEIS